MVGLNLAQHRSFFGGPSNEQLARLEQAANNNPNSASSQATFLSACMRANRPDVIVARYDSGQFATNSVIDKLYNNALTKTRENNGGGLTESTRQAVAQAVGANAGSAQVGRTTGGSGVKADPVYVVVEESTS
jgi:ATP-dependent metalloprotease